MLYLYEHKFHHIAQTLQSNQLHWWYLSIFLGERVKALRPASFLPPSNSRGLKEELYKPSQNR